MGAGFQGQGALGRMQVIGGADDYDVGRFGVQQGFQRRVGVGIVLCCQALNPVGEDVGDGRQCPAARYLCGMALADMPGADQRERYGSLGLRHLAS